MMLCWIPEHPTTYYASIGYPYGCNNYYGAERNRPRVLSRVREAKRPPRQERHTLWYR